MNDIERVKRMREDEKLEKQLKEWDKIDDSRRYTPIIVDDNGAAELGLTDRLIYMGLEKLDVIIEQNDEIIELLENIAKK